ncbi:hypothetical protein GCM10009789_07770 [Kribbella sancticallisti]|uniref:Uncharacterized protein n=1 Tax=Kribbella sancticallisti TaxID=460087 RepID=A0ABN2CD49_9ACTN
MSWEFHPREFTFSAWGSLALHDWADAAYRAGSDNDVYSLVMRQGGALGFADFGAAASSRPVWNLAEGADCWSTGLTPPEVFWLKLQVDNASRVVPLQSAGLVLQRAIDRIGVLTLDTLDLMTPLRPVRESPMDLAYGRDWYEFGDPAARRRASIDLVLNDRTTTEALLAEKTGPWLGDCLTFLEPATEPVSQPAARPVRLSGSRLIPDGTEATYHFEVVLGSDTLDFLAWVAETFVWALGDGPGESLVLRVSVDRGNPPAGPLHS